MIIGSFHLCYVMYQIQVCTDTTDCVAESRFDFDRQNVLAAKISVDSLSKDYFFFFKNLFLST